jgi:very-short-patch-repair endonuclease
MSFLQYINQGDKLRVPDGYWEEYSNHIVFKEYLAHKLGYKSDKDWYKITKTQIDKNGGSGLMVKKYNGSPLAFLKAVFPDICWYPWLFQSAPNGFWHSIDNQKQYIKWLMNKIGWTTLGDLYKLTNKILNENNGSGLGNIYNNCIIDLLVAVYPNGCENTIWYPWLLEGHAPNKYWLIKENRCKYLEWLFDRLNFTSMEDWYTVDQNTFRENYGSGLVLSKLYNSSHIKLIIDNLGDKYEFYPWNFSQCPQHYWKDYKNRLYFMKWFSNEHKLYTVDDWYNISSIFLKAKCGGLLGHYYSDSYIKLIIDLNPDLEFDKSKFSRWKTEGLVYKYLQEQDDNAIHGARFPWCKNNITNKNFPFDFCIEVLKLIIELDGPHHFVDLKHHKKGFIENQDRDVFKMKAAIEKGYRVIRLLQEDVLKGGEKWLDEHLKLHLTLEGDPVVYICPKNPNIYDSHNELMK